MGSRGQQPPTVGLHKLTSDFCALKLTRSHSVGASTQRGSSSFDGGARRERSKSDSALNAGKPRLSQSAGGPKSALTPQRNGAQSIGGGAVTDGDRFIAFRSDERLAFAAHALNGADKAAPSTSASEPSSPSPKTKRHLETQRRLLRAHSVDDVNTAEPAPRVLSFRKGLAPVDREGWARKNAFLYALQHASSMRKARGLRYIPKAPDRILDAPDLLDDFYMKHMDWSAENIVAVALANTVFLWKSDTGEVEELVTLEEEFPTSLRFTRDGRYLSVGTSQGRVKLYDFSRNACVRTMRTHQERIGCMDWWPSEAGIISAGARTGQTLHHDTRIGRHLVGTLGGHTAGVLAARWQKTGRHLVTTGDVVNVWDARVMRAAEPQPLWRFDDNIGIVKAVEYVPFLGASVNMIATGSGIGDTAVRIHSLDSGMCFSTVNVRHPVTSLHLNNDFREMVTTHNSSGHNVRLWKYTGEGEEKFVQTGELKGQEARVLDSVSDPAHRFLMTASADEIVRLWDLWPTDADAEAARKAAKPPLPTGAPPPRTLIR